jgi:phage tail sheath protein FI
MPFQLSPGVAVVEKDFTSIVPAVATSIGAFAGQFDWGPVLEPITITSEDELVRRFGTPNNNNFQSFFTAANFLSYSNNLLTVRQQTSNMKNAVVTPTGSISSVTMVQPGYGYISTEAPPAVVVYTDYLIDKITVTDGGQNYTAPPTVTITDGAGNGFGATATATIANGEVVAITVTSRGANYTAPVVSITGGNGFGATATATTLITVQEEGGVAPVGKAILSGGAITGLVVGNAGTGYTSAPTVSIIAAPGDTGSGATATATLNGTGITSYTIVNGGTGYTSPTISFTGGVKRAGGTVPTAHVTLTGGVITGFVIDDQGSGYTVAPTVTISDATGSNAQITVAVSPSGVLSFDITNGGSGYKAVPLVTVTSPTGSNASVGSITIGPSSIIGVTFDDGTAATNPGTGISGAPTLVIGAPPMGGSGASATANITTAGVAILNAQYYSANFINGGGVVGEWAAKYPGKLGNTLKVSMADAATYAQWAYKDEFDVAPGTSEAAARIGGTNDELHIIIIDEKGYISGVENSVLEKYAFVSKASDNKKSDGTNNYYKDVINSRSEWLWWTDHTDQITVPVTQSNWGNVMAGTNFHSMTAPLTQSLSGGYDDATTTDAQRIAAFDLFSNATLYDLNLIMAGKATSVVANYIIDNVALTRLDAVVFISPEDMQTGEVIIGDGSDAVNKIIAYRNSLGSNSYSVLDSGYKYQYDRYNDVYRWVPLNGDIAGLCARTDYTNDPWWSPGGLNRGQIKNVVRLSCNPNQAMRDNLYRNSVNPVVTFPGQGTVLWGDKTLLSKPSAFDRINVRRLFIVLEKSIATAAKYQLFEFNDAFTRGQFKNLIEPFLRDVQGRRGITDFLVKCDESNNTGEVIDRNEFIADIFVKPTRSINFITLNFVAARSSIAFSEIGA